MTTVRSAVDEQVGAQASWAPMIALFLAQVLMSFNGALLPVSIGGMVDDFDVPPTDVSTATVMYGLAVAALVMWGRTMDAGGPRRPRRARGRTGHHR